MRIIVTMILLGYSFCLSLANDYIKLKSGNVMLCKQNANVLLEFDYSNSEVSYETKSLFSNRTHMENWDEDWDEFASIAEKRFRNSFNKRSHTLNLVSDTTDVQYKLRVSFRNVDITGKIDFDELNSILGNGEECSVMLSGRIIIRKLNDDSKCVLTFSDIEGFDIESIDIAFKEAYNELAKELHNFIKEIEEAETL